MPQTLTVKMTLKDGRKPSAPLAIDLVHLSRQTLGDGALEAELLRLFDRQALSLATRLEAETNPHERIGRGELAHMLKGSARAIGAFGLAEAAERFETACRLDDPELPSLLKDLIEAIRIARADIASLV
jgi:HPt (histidine-containing phosphotransfer) domain-containing protein